MSCLWAFYMAPLSFWVSFLFSCLQAEDGIRYHKVTGVQTCALPICNAHLKSGFASFDAVEPPSRNIRSEPLQNFFQHIDSYAAGTVPVSGWVHSPDAKLQKQLAVDPAGHGHGAG